MLLLLKGPTNFRKEHCHNSFNFTSIKVQSYLKASEKIVEQAKINARMLVWTALWDSGLKFYPGET